MLNKLKAKQDITPFFTDDLLEHGYGVIINGAMPKDSYVAINIDEYYHHISLSIIPAIADILIVSQSISQKESFHIYIVEMKNISSPRHFTVQNIYEKFKTAIEDFMKIKYGDIFMDQNFHIKQFRLFFVTDVYKLKQGGYSEKQVKSFLAGTKIALLQKMPPFTYRNFKVMIEYQIPNPTLEWY